jgi:hypothetical protein
LWSYLSVYIGIGGDEGLAGSPKHWRGLDRDGRWWRGKRKLRFHLPACHSDTTYNVGSWRRRSIHCNLYKMAAVFGAPCIKRLLLWRWEINIAYIWQIKQVSIVNSAYGNHFFSLLSRICKNYNSHSLQNDLVIRKYTCIQNMSYK